jgi:hypothetical protein
LETGLIATKLKRMLGAKAGKERETKKQQKKKKEGRKNRP